MMHKKERDKFPKVKRKEFVTPEMLNKTHQKFFEAITTKTVLGRKP